MLEMVEMGPLFSMFSIIELCIGLKICFFRPLGFLEFGGLN
jgi:hypothetical protein